MHPFTVVLLAMGASHSTPSAPQQILRLEHLAAPVSLVSPLSAEVLRVGRPNVSQAPKFRSQPVISLVPTRVPSSSSLATALSRSAASPISLWASENPQPSTRNASSRIHDKILRAIQFQGAPAAK